MDWTVISYKPMTCCVFLICVLFFFYVASIDRCFTMFHSFWGILTDPNLYTIVWWCFDICRHVSMIFKSLGWWSPMTFSHVRGVQRCYHRETRDQVVQVMPPWTRASKERPGNSPCDWVHVGLWEVASWNSPQSDGRCCARVKPWVVLP